MLCVRGVRDSIISEQPGVILAVHQNDFAGFTCIGWRFDLGERNSGVHAVSSCTTLGCSLLARYEWAGGALNDREALLMQPRNKRFISNI